MSNNRYCSFIVFGQHFNSVCSRLIIGDARKLILYSIYPKVHDKHATLWMIIRYNWVKSISAVHIILWQTGKCDLRAIFGKLSYLHMFITDLVYNNSAKVRLP